MDIEQSNPKKRHLKLHFELVIFKTGSGQYGRMSFFSVFKWPMLIFQNRILPKWCFDAILAPLAPTKRLFWLKIIESISYQHKLHFHPFVGSNLSRVINLHQSESYRCAENQLKVQVYRQPVKSTLAQALALAHRIVPILSTSGRQCYPGRLGRFAFGHLNVVLLLSAQAGWSLDSSTPLGQLRTSTKPQILHRGGVASVQG